MNENKLVYIIGSSDIDAPLVIPAGAFIIAADAGLRHLRRAGISPDLVVGDFDSLGETPQGENVIFHPPEKDDTDMLLAVKQALSLGAKTIVMLGGLGGRFDHSIANLQTLVYITNNGAQGFLIGGGSVCTAIRDGGMGFAESMSGIISVFSLSDSCEGVTLRGLKYPLAGHTLTNGFPLGVSNEFTGAAASVSVKNGVLAIVWQGGELLSGRLFPSVIPSSAGA